VEKRTSKEIINSLRADVYCFLYFRVKQLKCKYVVCCQGFLLCVASSRQMLAPALQTSARADLSHALLSTIVASL